MTSARKEEVPAYRLYTSEEAAARVDPTGLLGARFFLRLAASGKVTCTRMGRKVFWTETQIAAAVAYHASTATTAKSANHGTQPPPAQPRNSRTAAAPRGRRAPAPLVATPGRRYQSLESR